MQQRKASNYILGIMYRTVLEKTHTVKKTFIVGMTHMLSPEIMKNRVLI